MAFKREVEARQLRLPAAARDEFIDAVHTRRRERCVDVARPGPLLKAAPAACGAPPQTDVVGRRRDHHARAATGPVRTRVAKGGVDEQHMDDVLPNRANFNASDLFSQADLFDEE